MPSSIIAFSVPVMDSQGLSASAVRTSSSKQRIITMKTGALFISLIAGASAFGVVTPNVASRVTLSAQLSEAEMTETQKEIKGIQEKWSAVRFMSAEEVATLEPEWKEASERYNTKYNDDMDRMKDIAKKLQKMIEPPKIQKKTEGQRRRDKWAIVQARAAARASKK